MRYEPCQISRKWSRHTQLLDILQEGNYDTFQTDCKKISRFHRTDPHPFWYGLDKFESPILVKSQYTRTQAETYKIKACGRDEELLRSGLQICVTYPARKSGPCKTRRSVLQRFEGIMGLQLSGAPFESQRAITLKRCTKI